MKTLGWARTGGLKNALFLSLAVHVALMLRGGKSLVGSTFYSFPFSFAVFNTTFSPLPASKSRLTALGAVDKGCNFV